MKTKTFYDCIKIRSIDAGIQIKDLLKKTGIPEATFYDHKLRKGWTQMDIARMNKYLHFTAEDLQIFAEGR
jgi:hypothetical protein